MKHKNLFSVFPNKKLVITLKICVRHQQISSHFNMNVSEEVTKLFRKPSGLLNIS